MSLLNEILEQREKLDSLENEYLDTTPSCMNKKCNFWYDNNASGYLHSVNCTWSALVEQCKDYIPEE